MEKGSEKIIRIAITGPESTAKSTISEYLAGHYDTIWVKEFARDYIEGLGRNYSFEDVEKIAKSQVSQYIETEKTESRIVFFDTWLIITKVWFSEVYGIIPGWMDESIRSLKMDYYLICAPDIEWVPDTVRENGGERRQELFDKYEREIKHLSVPYSIIYGKGEQRFSNARSAIDNFLKMNFNG